jgi:hypothetical protein
MSRSKIDKLILRKYVAWATSVSIFHGIALTATSEDRALLMPFPLTVKNPNVTVAQIYVEVRKMRIP